MCGAIITARDHLHWLYNKLGPLAYANPTLMLTSLGELQIVDEPAEQPSRQKSDEVTRGDRMRVLCPECRSNVSVII